MMHVSCIHICMSHRRRHSPQIVPDALCSYLYTNHTNWNWSAARKIDVHQWWIIVCRSHFYSVWKCKKRHWQQWHRVRVSDSIALPTSTPPPIRLWRCGHRHYNMVPCTISYSPPQLCAPAQCAPLYTTHVHRTPMSPTLRNAHHISGHE